MIRKLDKDDIDKVTQIWLEVNIRTHNFIPEKYWAEQFNDVTQLIKEKDSMLISGV